MILVTMLGIIDELILTLPLGGRARSFWCYVIKGKRTHHTLVKNRLNVFINYPMIKNLSEAVTSVASLGKDFPGLYSLRKSTRKAKATECKKNQCPSVPNDTSTSSLPK